MLVLCLVNMSDLSTERKRVDRKVDDTETRFVLTPEGARFVAAGEASGWASYQTYTDKSLCCLSMFLGWPRTQREIFERFASSCRAAMRSKLELSAAVFHHVAVDSRFLLKVLIRLRLAKKIDSLVYCPYYLPKT